MIRGKRPMVKIVLPMTGNPNKKFNDYMDKLQKP